MALNFSYSENLEAGRLGQIATTEDINLITRVAEVDDIPIGCPLEPGNTTVHGPGHSNIDNTEGAAVKPYDGGQFVGITVRERSIRSDNNDMYKKGDDLRMATNYGDMWVEVDGPVAVGDRVHVNAGATQFGVAGDPINALFETSAAAAGELAIIRLQSLA